MSTVRISTRLGETDIEITESNTDRLGPSISYGAPIDFDRLAEPVAGLLASAVRRTCDAAGIPLRDIDIMVRTTP